MKDAACEQAVVRAIMGQAVNAAYAADEERWSALMLNAQAGHEADYRKLLGELSVVISRYLSSRIGAHAYLDDCVQETLIAIHQARHTFDARRKFRPWLFAIVRHKAIDALRKQQSIHKLAQQQGIVEESSTPSAALEEGIEGGRLINSLSTPDRDVITLTKIVGLTNAEAATRLDISEGAVKVRVHRAIGKLQRMMEADAI